jgi:hypothetical protein
MHIVASIEEVIYGGNSAKSQVWRYCLGIVKIKGTVRRMRS